MKKMFAVLVSMALLVSVRWYLLYGLVVIRTKMKLAPLALQDPEMMLKGTKLIRV